MNGSNLLVDTNIALYLLNGDQTVAALLNEKNVFISFITELELLGYKELSEQETLNIRAFLKDVTIIDLNSDIKNIVVEIRKKYRIKLPDAIIAGSASYLNIPLITSDAVFSKMPEVSTLIYER
jgi:predicted nucleic acid-binding protein